MTCAVTLMTKANISLNKPTGSFCGGASFLQGDSGTGTEGARDCPSIFPCGVSSGEFAVRHEPVEVEGSDCSCSLAGEQRTLSDRISGSVRAQREMLCDTELCFTASGH